MVLGRHKQKEVINLKINGAEIKGQNSVTLLGVEIDNELNFNNLISNICKKAVNKINGFSRIQSFLGQKEKEALVNTFVYSNFNYCSLVWHFSTNKSINKIEKIQERCLKLSCSNTTETYDDLLVKTSQSFVEIKRLRTLATEICKTLNDINPNYMKEIFYLSPHETHKKYYIFIHRCNITKNDNHSLRGPHIWNSLPEEIKQLSSLNGFKNYIKSWCGQKSKCYLCQTSL